MVEYQPGRELDCEVASVLGWSLEEVSGDFFVRVVTDMYEGQETLERLPDFSTTWEGMQTLVEEVRKKFKLQLILISDEDGHHASIYERTGELNKDECLAFQDHKDNAPYAVSQAFVNAASGEENSLSK